MAEDTAPKASALLSTLTPPGNLFSSYTAGQAALVDYTVMFENDAQARQAIDFSGNIILNLIGAYQHPDERIQQFVRDAIGAMRGNWSAALRYLLRARTYGFMVMEKVWGEAVVDGRSAWVYDALLPVAPKSLTKDAITMDRARGIVQEVRQWVAAGQDRIVRLPGEKVVHWAYDDMGDGYGTPLGKSMWPLYQAKRGAQEAWASAVQWRGLPPIYERVPQMDLNTVDGLDKTYAEVAAETWKQAKSGAVIMRPVPPGDNWSDKGLPHVEVLQGSAFGNEFESHIAYQEKGYWLAQGLPYLLMNEAQFGTRAQSVVHSDAARFGALPVAKEFVESCVLRSLIRPLLEVNFGPQDDYGDFPCTLPLDLEFFSGILTSLASAGVLGMMVPFPVYQLLQAAIPQILPEVEEQNYAGENLAPLAAVPASEPEETETTEEDVEA